jgi:hypothetical protein
MLYIELVIWFEYVHNIHFMNPRHKTQIVFVANVEGRPLKSVGGAASVLIAIRE